LVEKGKLSLDDDFTKYIDFDTKGRTISINRLLNHTSGIPSYTELPEIEDIGVRSYDRDTLLRIVEQNDFLFEPGEAMIYNNSAYFILGLIIEKITEKNYEDYLKEEFFEPLGMNNTYYSSTSKVIPNRAYGYTYTESGLIQKEYIDYTWPYSAGSLSSTTEDLLIWMRALHEGKVFNERFYDTLIRPGQLNDGAKLRYAMGLVNYINFGHREIGHGGGIPGFLTSTIYFPDDDLFIICLVNTMGPKGARFFADELAWKLLEKHENDPVELDVNLDTFKGRYTGQIRGQVISIDVKAQSNFLIISTEGQNQVDTLDLYIGNNTWSEGISLIMIKDNVYARDDIYGYFKLAKDR
jgi:CubicO group peptidase (beta-lactamase class C family)